MASPPVATRVRDPFGDPWRPTKRSAPGPHDHHQQPPPQARTRPCSRAPRPRRLGCRPPITPAPGVAEQAGDPEIAVEHDDPLCLPPQLDGLFGQRVLTLGRANVLPDTPRAANPPAGHHRRSQLLHHHRCQPTGKAGLQRPKRKVRHNGCRDRRSRRPPPWSTLDMNNADFDTLFMTPGPGSSHASGPEHRQNAPHSERPGRQPAPITTRTAAPRRAPAHSTAQNPRIYRASPNSSELRRDLA
jgi:hypothetical protein